LFKDGAVHHEKGIFIIDQGEAFPQLLLPEKHVQYHQ
jgi:hypothetical protein